MKSSDEEVIQVMGKPIEDDSAPNMPPAPLQQSSQVNNNNKDKSRRQKVLYFAALLLVAAVTAALTWFLTSSIDNSNSPSSMAENELLFDPPSTHDCVSIATGESLPNQTLSRNFELPLDVVLLDSDSKMEDYMQELMAAIQQYLIPSLAGCFVDDDLSGRRSLGSLNRALKSSPSTRFAILNAIATGEYRVDNNMCDHQASEDFCHRVSVYLTVFLKGDIEISEIVTLLSAEGLDDNRGRLVDRLRLENPFGNVYIRGVNSMSPTPPPSAAPSDEPEPLVYDTPSGSDGFALMQAGKKCPIRGDYRLFRIDYNGNVETCYEACLADEACVAFSAGGWCIGCNIAVEWFEREDNATAYAMTTRSTPIEGSVLAGHNLKCPQDSNTRLFKVFDVTTYDECWDLCFNTEGCGSFTVGVDGFGRQVCMGCEYLTRDQFTPEDGRTVYWMDPPS